MAVGLAYSGKIPFANTFAFLFATRALEMIRTHLCYGEANVKLMAAYAGISDSYDGPTHHAISDVAIMRSLPKMTIVVPGDTVAVAKLLPQVAAWPGPVYFRLNRNEVPLIFDEHYAPEIGKAVSLRAGRDVTLICNGMLVSRCLDAADWLAAEGIGAAVLEMHTVKPLDTAAILDAAARPAHWSPPRKAASSAGWAARWPRRSQTPSPCPSGGWAWPTGLRKPGLTRRCSIATGYRWTMWSPPRGPPSPPNAPERSIAGRSP